jgi:hypothetical protein
MKSWFIFYINGKQVGTWANNADEAKENMIAEFGDIPMEFIGINYNDIGPKVDEAIYRGMSGVDMMIASGLLNYWRM